MLTIMIKSSGAL